MMLFNKKVPFFGKVPLLFKRKFCQFEVGNKHKFIKVLFVLISALITVLYSNRAEASSTKQIETAGDITQVVGPIVAASIAGREAGVGHFAIIFAQDIAFMGAIKMVGNSTKMKAAKRPKRKNKRDKYDGFPSGHTTSAWGAASYNRVFSEEYKIMTVPLYISAAFTGYSRIKSKKHNTVQVVSAAIITEIITELNSKMNWSNEYRQANIGVTPEEYSLRFNMKL